MWLTDRRISSTNTAASIRAGQAPRAHTETRGRSAARSTVVTTALAAALLIATGPATARAADPAPANVAAPSVVAVTPEQFAAGATITITGAGFMAGDTVKLDSKVLTDLKVSDDSITATVPASTLAGKKLVVTRGKQKLGELTAFRFVPAPKLSSVSPKFAAPGETVTLKGKALDQVSALSVGGVAVAIAEQSATALKFVVPEGLQTGAVRVQSLGGEAGLKADYEVFRAPVLASAAPPAAFEGDSVIVKGEHLTGKIQFKLGSKVLKASAQAATEATLVVAKGSKTGPLRATARGKTGSLAADFTVFPTPLLTTVPAEVGAPGELKVSGKHLDAVTTWRLGQVTLTPAQAASAGKVVLAIPAEAPADQPLIAVSQGREFASKRPVATVKTPIVHGLAFWPAGKGVDGVIRGADFSSKTTFTLAGKPLKTRFVAADRVEFSLATAPAAARLALAAKAGKYSGAPVEVDGAAGGYRVPAAQLAGLLPTGLKDYDLVAAQLDLEASEQLVRAVEAAAQQRPAGDQVAALGLRLAQDLQRVTLAQAAVCATMTTGKGKEQAAANAAAGEVLRQSQRHAQALGAALKQLWATLGRDALAAAGLPAVDAAVAPLVGAGPKVQAACKNRFYGVDKLVTEASTTVALDLDRLYHPAILAAFADLLAQGKSWAAVEKPANERLAALPAPRRKLWQDVLKASKSAVEAGAGAGVTGKGATGDKHVETQGKPTSNTGKGGKGGKGS